MAQVPVPWRVPARQTTSGGSTCCFLDDSSEFARQVGHSHVTTVTQLAAEAPAARLVLIHLSSFRPETGEPELAYACSLLPRTEFAYDGTEIEF
jgi:ribonuclease BN (tRNA processing enzyme)